MLRHFFVVLLVALAAPVAAQAPACGSRLFVSSYFTTVHVYDACTGAYLRNLDDTPRLSGPQAVKLGPDGLLYVTSEMTQQILRYRNDTLEFVDVFATFVGVDPTGFAFAPNGDVYVAAFRTDDVRRLSAAGLALDTPVPPRTAGLDGPDNGITFGPDGNLYIPGYDSSSVVRHDPRTGATTVVVPRGTQGLINTRGILAERSGASLLITGEGSGRLLRFDLATGNVTLVAAGLGQPTGMDYAPDGDLLIVEVDRVSRFDAATGARKGVLVTPGSGGITSGTYAAVIPFAAPPVSKVPAVEYYHTGLDHYFVSSLPADVAALDSGALQGWARTGFVFNVYPQAVAGASPVCRFYLPPANGDSHFYSASPAECAEVRAKFPTFVYEAGDVMHVALPDTTTGACPPDTVKVFRLWNNRADSNHRYTADATVKAAMLAKGYVAEGYGPDATIMCAPA
jgi:DNA-binding beta-propeller fold protein YncE